MFSLTCRYCTCSLLAVLFCSRVDTLWIHLIMIMLQLEQARFLV